MRLFNSSHLGLDKVAKRALFCNSTNFAAEPLILLWQTGQKSLGELDLSVRQMHLWVCFVELQRVAGLAVPVEADGLVICAGGILVVTVRTLQQAAVGCNDLRGEMFLMAEA